jgi:hypothetical protein
MQSIKPIVILLLFINNIHYTFYVGVKVDSQSVSQCENNDTNYYCGLYNGIRPYNSDYS